MPEEAGIPDVGAGVLMVLLACSQTHANHTLISPSPQSRMGWDGDASAELQQVFKEPNAECDPACVLVLCSAAALAPHAPQRLSVWARSLMPASAPTASGQMPSAPMARRATGCISSTTSASRRYGACIRDSPIGQGPTFTMMPVLKKCHQRFELAAGSHHSADILVTSCPD